VEKNQEVVAQYQYDGDGRRIKKTEWVEDLQEYQTTIYVYSGLNILYKKNLDTDQDVTFIYGPTGRIAKNMNGLTDYYHTDQLGSTRLVTDESGNPVGEVNYEPFGESTGTGDKKEHLFTGKEKDSTGLYYYGARYYDPEIGRWIERDLRRGTVENPISLNRYVYCYNNPLRYVDPDGLDPVVNDLTADLTTEFWLAGTLVAAPTIVGGIVWGIGGGLYRYWLERNWNAECILDAEGNPVISIYAKGNTPAIGAYFASITIKANDEGDYRGNIRNASTTLVSVSVYHFGSGNLDLFLSGSGPQLLAIFGSGEVNIHLEDCTGLVTLNIMGTGTVTIFVPMGQEPPQIIGGGDYVITYYEPEDEVDEIHEPS
jgi:RHS repeat-associated protein